MVALVVVVAHPSQGGPREGERGLWGHTRHKSYKSRPQAVTYLLDRPQDAELTSDADAEVAAGPVARRVPREVGDVVQARREESPGFLLREKSVIINYRRPTPAMQPRWR